MKEKITPRRSEKFDEATYEDELGVEIQRALDNAPPEEEYKKCIRRLRELREVPNLMSNEGLREEYESLNASIQACEVLVGSIVEYRILLESFGYSGEDLSKLLNH